MRLYAGTSTQFIEDSIQNQIAEKLRLAFFEYFRQQPSPSEVRSWQNSLRALSQTFQHAGLTDHGVILEYWLPLSPKRLDCLICGKDQDQADNAVIIELKQWESCDRAEGERILTWVGGKREVLHPSVQVGQYKMYLEDGHTAFSSEVDPVQLHACTYLHNYHTVDDDPLFEAKFSQALTDYPLFGAGDVGSLKDFLRMRLSGGRGTETLQRIEESRYRPSKKLMNHVAEVVKGKPEYVLLDEQLLVYDKIVSTARKGFHDRKKTVLIVKGGPGTGKSIIAINALGDLSAQGYNTQYATGSKAFTETLRSIIGPRGAAQFKYFNSYADAEANAIDVLVADESHRIRETSQSRFTPKAQRSDLPQIEELLNAAKVCVFFIDDAQIVRPNEIGSVEYIKKYASQRGCAIFEYQLEAQFRCNGSNGFVNWVNNTLGIERTANVIWDQHEEFDFRIFSSPDRLEQAIRQKEQEGYTARLTAGFCWPWSEPDENGALRGDVHIGSFVRPWNARPEARILAPGIPKASLWAHDPRGIDQIGCVYTAQGFEFDYVGVIIGKDLVYDPRRGQWLGVKEESKDAVVKRSGDQFLDLVKNTYRILLTRGMKGCYVYFMDEDTENFFRSRIEGQEQGYAEEEDGELATIF